ncbi:site-specific integrase [uncultured Alistipes sp.]|uniref:site-specific integrase n=1 Tax=uncultured Alistipes sp. TaxID=538949 RepID=UPI0025DD9D36|nr:site-specific integrase [uncultured Alistipes sp.]
MERKRFSVTYFLRKARTNKAGLTPILARITTNGISKEIYIQCSVPADKWSQSKERATGKDKLCQQVNSYLDDYRARILAVRQELISKGYEGNCIQIKERLQNPTTLSIMFLAELAKYCEKRQAEVGVRITQLTANKYHRVLRNLREYVASAYRKEDLLLSAVGYEFLDGFNTFLQTAHRCKHNGAVNLLDCVKNFTRYCLRNEWIEKDPFRNYKLKEEHNKEKDHLTREELETLVQKRLPNERLDRIRDVFAFCCFTGLAFTDAEHLRQEHIRTDDNGTTWIHKPREKTAIMSRIPLLPYPMILLEKYERDAELRATGKLLPVPSNQKMNAYLKEIADLCNIPKNLTTHVARHTFACLAVEYGMPIDVLAKILGHSNTNMTRHYAKFSEQSIGREMRKMNEQMFSGDILSLNQ